MATGATTWLCASEMVTAVTLLLKKNVAAYGGDVNISKRLTTLLWKLTMDLGTNINKNNLWNVVLAFYFFIFFYLITHAFVVNSAYSFRCFQQKQQQQKKLFVMGTVHVKGIQRRKRYL